MQEVTRSHNECNPAQYGSSGCLMLMAKRVVDWSMNMVAYPEQLPLSFARFTSPCTRNTGYPGHVRSVEAERGFLPPGCTRVELSSFHRQAIHHPSRHVDGGGTRTGCLDKWRFTHTDTRTRRKKRGV